MSAYGQSKLAVLMFALELDRRSRAGGWGIVSNAAHPGLTKTNLQIAGPSHGREKPALMERLVQGVLAFHAVSVAGDRRRDPAGAVRGGRAARRRRRVLRATRVPRARRRRGDGWPRCPSAPATRTTADDCGSFPSSSPASATRSRADDYRWDMRPEPRMPESSIVVRPSRRTARLHPVVAAAGRRAGASHRVVRAGRRAGAAAHSPRSRSSSPTTAPPTGTTRSNRCRRRSRCCAAAPVTTTQSWWRTPTYRTTTSRPCFTPCPTTPKVICNSTRRRSRRRSAARSTTRSCRPRRSTSAGRRGRRSG